MVIQTWSRSDIVLAVPVLAAALASTLSGTGVNLEGKKRGVLDMVGYIL